jgi:g-D-glutamyl-meso-diaminopimelate peptidase
MKILKFGSKGPQVQLLQLALTRAGFNPGSIDGIFGSRTNVALKNFQRQNNLVPDGIAGRLTHRALHPWYTGYALHILQPGDSFYRLSLQYGTDLEAIMVANPGMNPLNLQPGDKVIIPLDFPVVPTEIDYTHDLVGFCVEGLSKRYPFLTAGELGKSVMGNPLHTLQFGTGETVVLYNAAHHANEWITTPVLLKFIEDLAAAYAGGRSLAGISAKAIFDVSSIYFVPAVNPDGIDLVTGALTGGRFYDNAVRMSKNYPAMPFPSGWKANISGVDLNLQYPAGWEQARTIKFDQGFTLPGPRDYVGPAPLSEPESRALYTFTRALSPALTLSYHTQGRVIYWKYLDNIPPQAEEIAELFGQLSGYSVENTPYASGFAGYKDWFIQDFNRPGYTIECGLGENPLPLSQFSQIYQENIGILTTAAIVTSPWYADSIFAG